MQPDRWLQIKSIFTEAIERPEAERDEYLDQACAGDAALRGELNKLLAHGSDTQTINLIENKRARNSLAPGEVLDARFRIVRFVGKGGMGEVYEALDTDLKSTVALKVLRPELSQDEDFLQRFRREVQTARQVTHPNVCRVYDLGYDRQRPTPLVFLTMEFLSGETLGQRLRTSGPLSPADALPLIRQFTAGLGALHGQGIVHRDFKPGNILLAPAPSGPERAVISDFGLARALDPPEGFTITQTDQVLGTPDYMAPEQLLGQAATPASDIYALGLIMYEIVTGHKPFPGGQPLENAVKRVVEQPTPPSDRSTSISKQWNSTILQCLARRPEDRPQSAAQVLALLEGCQRPAPSSAPLFLRSKLFLAAALFLLISLALFPFRTRLAGWLNRSTASTADAQHLALLPLRVIGDDPSLRVFADGLMETVTSRMSQFEDNKAPILVVPASEVRSQGAKTAGEARTKFNVATAVEGAIETQGDRLRLLFTLIDTTTMRQVETISIDDQRGNSWRLQDGAVKRLANALNLRLQARYASEQQASNPIAPGAYEFYLQARGYLQRNDQAKSRESAITLLKRALDLDPNFAPAHSALGQAFLYEFLNNRDPKMMEAALASGRRAIEINPNLPEANITLGQIYYGSSRHQEARQLFEKAIAIDSRNHEAYQGLAKAFLGLKDYANAEATYRKAISLRPDDWTGYKALALFYYEREVHAKAAQQFQKVIDLTPDNAQGYSNLGVALYGLKNYEGAEKAWLQVLQLNPKDEGAMVNLGKLYLDEKHQPAKAIEMYQQAISLNSRRYRTWGQLGRAFARSNQLTQASQAYAKAIELIDAEIRIAPQTPALHSALGFYCALLGKQDYLPSVERALELAPNHRDTLLRAAETFAVAGNRDRAAQILGVAVARGLPLQSIQRSEYLTGIQPKNESPKGK